MIISSNLFSEFINSFDIFSSTLTIEKAPEFLATLVTNPPKEFTEQAFRLAQERTFQTPLKKRGDAIGDTANFISELKNAPKEARQ